MKTYSLFKYTLLVSSTYLFSCEEPADQLPTEPTANVAAPASAATTGLTFTSGLLTEPIVPLTQLYDLGGELDNSQLVVSNNPEVVVTDGWLLRPPTNAQGERTLIRGTANLYLYHDNRDALGRDLYLHVLATNPNSTPITVAARGNIYTRREYDGYNGRGFGPSYQVALDWMNNRFTQNATATAAASGGYASLSVVSFPRSTTIDGRLEITAPPEGCFVYVVVSTSANPATAVNLSQTKRSEGTYTDLNTGEERNVFFPEEPNTFGRQAGVYVHSGWGGETPIQLPEGPGHVGLCLNTTGKFALPGTNQFLQNQCSPAVAVIDESSTFTWGNYGFYYNIVLNLLNDSNRGRNVKVYLATNQAGSNAASFFFHAPVRAAGQLIDVFNTGGAPRTVIFDGVVSGTEQAVPIQFYVPGLISAGQQLIVEVTD